MMGLLTMCTLRRMIRLLPLITLRHMIGLLTMITLRHIIGLLTGAALRHIIALMATITTLKIALLTMPAHLPTTLPPPTSRSRSPTPRRTQGRAHRRRDIAQQLRSSRPRPNAATAITTAMQLRERRPRQHPGAWDRTGLCAGECGGIILALVLIIGATAAPEDQP